MRVTKRITKIYSHTGSVESATEDANTTLELLQERKPELKAMQCSVAGSTFVVTIVLELNGDPVEVDGPLTR